MTCTFFGHKDCPCTTTINLLSVLTDLIENKNVNMFYIGNQGDFDSIARTVLQKMKIIYPQINYVIVLAYLRNKSEISDFDTVFPEGLENVPLRYAIDRRNLWMINHSDYVITYVRNTAGGAYKFKTIAEKKGKIVINI